MTKQCWERLRLDLIRDEGDKVYPYTDTTGNLTIGVGHNLTACGISQAIRDMLLTEDIVIALGKATTFPWFEHLNEVRQRVIVNMVFNMGMARVEEFTLMIQAIKNGDYTEATRQMLDSTWAQQVGDRADRLAHMFLSGNEL